jgi:hypothetical protein
MGEKLIGNCQTKAMGIMPHHDVASKIKERYRL